MLFAAALSFLSMSLAATPASGNYKVEVDGKTYRVKVQGTQVGVFNKSLVSYRSPEIRDVMRRAVREAVGCNIRDDYWEGSHLVGMLECSANEAVPPKTPASPS